jgi:hypothetical protein
VPFFFPRLTEPVLASGHWYSSPLVGVAIFLAGIGYWVLIGVLMIHAISGLPRAIWALVIALALIAASVAGVIWLYVR